MAEKALYEKLLNILETIDREKYTDIVSIIECNIEDDGTVYMDFTLGYGKNDHPTLEKAERTLKPTDDKIEIYDRYEFDGDAVITERFVTTVKPIVDGNSVILDDVRFTCEGGATLNIVEQPYVDQLPDENGNYNKICYLLDYTLNKGVYEFAATIDFIK